jgi:hypothetical protein
MPFYEIIEIESGLTVAELEPGSSPEEVAARHHGTVVDPGPYRTYDEAYDAILTIKEDDDDDRDDWL